MDVSKRKQRRQQWGEVVAHPAVAALPFEQALAAFLAAQEGSGHSRVTCHDYQMTVCFFWAYMVTTHGYTAVQQVTEADLYGWLAHLRNGTSRLGRPYSSRTIQTYARDVKVFFRWLVAHGYLALNPMQHIKMPKVERPLIRVFTEEELQQLDVACERPGQGHALTGDEGKALAARDRAILWLLLSTGIRRLELCRLRLGDIDWDKGLLTILGKGAKGRKVPFGKVARQHVDTYLRYWRGQAVDGDEAVFLTLAGEPIQSHTIQGVFERLKQEARITDKRVSAHTCRHWFAVNCIKQGMPTAALRDLLGHEDWAMIDVYVQLAEQDQRQLYLRYSPVDALEMHQATKGKRQQIRAWRANRKKPV